MSRNLRTATAEPMAPITAPMIDDEHLGDDHVVAGHDRRGELPEVPDQRPDAEVAEQHDAGGHDRSDQPLHEALDHEGQADEPARRPDEAHHPDLATAGEDRHSDGVQDQHEGRDHQHQGDHEQHHLQDVAHRGERVRRLGGIGGLEDPREVLEDARHAGRRRRVGKSALEHGRGRRSVSTLQTVGPLIRQASS